jgi:hypothetical protein
VNRPPCIAHRPPQDRPKNGGWYEQNSFRRRAGRTSHRWPQTRQTYQRMESLPRRAHERPPDGSYTRQGILLRGRVFQVSERSRDRRSRKGHSRSDHEDPSRGKSLAGSAKGSFFAPRGGSDDEAGVARPPLRRDPTRRNLGEMSSRRLKTHVQLGAVRSI